MFDNKNFSVMAYANGFTLWNYSTADTLDTVKTSGYFNSLEAFARPGDMILVVAGKETQIAAAIMVISSVSDGTVSATVLAPSATASAPAQS